MNWQMGLELCQLFHLKLKEKKKKSLHCSSSIDFLLYFDPILYHIAFKTEKYVTNSSMYVSVISLLTKLFLAVNQPVAEGASPNFCLE